MEKGEVKNFPKGEFRIDIRDENGDFEISFKKWKNKRTINQNGAMWFYFTELGKECGYTKDQIRKLVERVEEFQDLFTEVVYDERLEKDVVLARGTSDFSVQEMSNFLERFRIWAMEFFGVHLPDARDYNN